MGVWLLSPVDLSTNSMGREGKSYVWQLFVLISKNYTIFDVCAFDNYLFDFLEVYYNIDEKTILYIIDTSFDTFTLVLFEIITVEKTPLL